MKKIAEISKAMLKLAELKTVDDLTETKSLKDFESERILKNINKYKDINLNDVNNLIDEIKKYITINDNSLGLGDDEYVYFSYINDFFLHDIKNGKINDFNREKNIMQSLEILKTSSQIKKNMVNI